jgi:hypothetical protein
MKGTVDCCKLNFGVIVELCRGFGELGLGSFAMATPEEEK